MTSATQVTDFVKVTAISELQQDARGTDYRRITLQGSPTFLPAVDPETGEAFNAMLPGKIGSVNAYGDPSQGPNSFLFATKVGARFAGTVLTRNVHEYSTQRASYNTYTCVVFGDTTAEDFEEVVMREFRRNKRPLLTDTDYDPTPRAIAVKEPAQQPAQPAPVAAAQPVAAPAQPAQPEAAPQATVPVPAAPDLDEAEEW